MKNLRLFETVDEFISDYNNNYIEPWASYTKEVEDVAYNKLIVPDPRDMYLTFEITSDGVIKWKASYSGLTKTIEYSKDSGTTWTSITSTTGGTDISVVSGDMVQFRGDNATYATSGVYVYDYNTFSGTTASFNVRGNIMSLINKTDFAELDTISSSHTFYSLFANCTGLTSAEHLTLPATTLARVCYSSMFVGCTSLTTAPALPATTLAQECYYSMFGKCTKLSKTSKLPATTLSDGCYYSMFSGCTSLTSAPKLPATTLAKNCYTCMFQGCTGLTKAPELPATTLAVSCYRGMFQGCTGLTSAPELPAIRVYDSSYYYMFQGCTNLTTAPELPATSIGAYSYCDMFKNCTNLINAPELPATVAPEGCYENMFENCRSLTTAPALPATAVSTESYFGMFKGCINIVRGPEISAKYFKNFCFTEMFSGCSKLNYIKCVTNGKESPTAPNPQEPTRDWVTGVQTVSGTFVKHPDASWSRGNYGVPNNCTIENAS